MRIGNVSGRLVIEAGGRYVDVERASGGNFSADPMAVYDVWDDVVAWAATADLASAEGVPVEGTRLDCPVPRPRQIFAIGLNYRDHAAESKLDIPEHPVVFTKFVSSLAGPGDVVTLPSDGIDWEVELTVVVGREAHQVAREDGWGVVAGLTIAQDLSNRAVQLRGPAPQFSLGKSFPGFTPVGPVVVTPDEVPDRDDLALSCALDGEVLQDGRTRDLIFDVPELIARLSAIVTLYPGDLILTGTPAGVGAGRTPKRFLTPGVLTSRIEGIGELSITLQATA